MPKGSTVSVDVQDQLMKERTRRRKPGTIPYPVQYTKDSHVYDSWNNLFLNSLCLSVTMHTFDTPPLMVLDLGCGNGTWILEAAKVWPKCKFVGFDMQAIQPDLTLHNMGVPDLASRVSWMHGNLLETLPFPNSHFDFVRICCIGLGVPEDEWQYVLEETARVTKLGGSIELIEEDLIFPCGKSRRERHLASQPSFGSSSTLSYSSNSSPSGHPPTSGSGSGSQPPRPVSQPMPYSMDVSHGRSLSPDIDQLLDPQDHSKLQMAWQEMLHRRFLNPTLISVLPFYLSANYRNIHILPALLIALPMNSSPEDSGYATASSYHYDSAPPELENLYFDMKTHGIRLSSESRADTASMRSRHATSHVITSWSSLHLAKSVNLIRGCKEAIWAEYKDLKGFDEEPGKRRVVQLREEFEAAWANWENDMKDRIGMHGKLGEFLSWAEPPPGERTDWRVWRERVGELEMSETDSDGTPVTLCRSMRGLVGWKNENKLVF
ncbi:S-adenosyl-L-methionine-dependent methyltransferase [Amylocystis lapponica]|nr:S-adenosyl-L-methionine-dependent methyltransferase [Amylocystis lapponica]